ncbi:unnamed protein product [Closterium sp. NIES-53]
MAATKITRAIVPPWALSPTPPRQRTFIASTAVSDPRLAASNSAFISGRLGISARLLEPRGSTSAHKHASQAIGVNGSPGFAVPGGARTGKARALVLVSAAFAKKVKVGAGRLKWPPMRRDGENVQPKSVSQRRWEVLMSELLAAGKRRRVGAAADGRLVAEIMADAREAGWVQRTDVVGALVRLHQLRMWHAVVEAPEQRASGWWRMSERDYAMLITAAARCHQLPRAEQALRDLMNEPAEAEDVEGGVEGGAEKGRPAEGKGAGKRMEPNTVVMTGMVEAYARNGQLEQAEAVVRRMESKGPAPSALTYQCLLKGYASVSARGGGG